MFKKIVSMICVIAISVSLLGCSSNKTKDVSIETPSAKIEQSVLVRPNSNEDFRYNIYTHYVEISQCLSTKSNIVIPDTIQDLPVYKICANAFKNQTTIKTLVISNNVIEIGENAFRGCSNLESVILSNNLEKLGSCAFADCSNIKEITIPNSLYCVSSDAFNGCIRLLSVTIGDRLNDDTEKEKTLSSGSFANCPELRVIWIPSCVTTMEDNCLNDSTENIVICGNEESTAAAFAARNLLDFKTIDEFKSLSSSALATQKKMLDEAAESNSYKMCLRSVHQFNSNFEYNSGGNKYVEEVNEDDNIVFLTFQIENLSGSTKKVNYLDFYIDVDGYKRRVSSYGYVESIGESSSFLNSEIEANASILGSVAVRVPASWHTISVIYKGDIALESNAFIVNSSDSFIVKHSAEKITTQQSVSEPVTTPTEEITTEPSLSDVIGEPTTVSESVSATEETTQVMG